MSDSQESQFLSVIRVWAAVAWADGVIAESEAVAMKRLIATANLTEQETETALSWLDNKVDLDTTNVAELNEQARQGIYRAAVRLAVVDLEVADEERSFLMRLREGLNISEEDAKQIGEEIARHSND